MKSKKYHTVEAVPRPNIKRVERDKSIPLIQYALRQQNRIDNLLTMS